MDINISITYDEISYFGKNVVVFDQKYMSWSRENKSAKILHMLMIGNLLEYTLYILIFMNCVIINMQFLNTITLGC